MFVKHETLSVQRDDFVNGADPNNPWPEVFDEFSEQICQHISADSHDLLTPEFATTGLNEKAASQVILMDTLKNYFQFDFEGHWLYSGMFLHSFSWPCVSVRLPTPVRANYI